MFILYKTCNVSKVYSGEIKLNFDATSYINWRVMKKIAFTGDRKLLY